MLASAEATSMPSQLPTLLTSRAPTFAVQQKSVKKVVHPSVPASNEGRRVAFVTIPLTGHMRVAVSLATEMSKRGYTVDFLIDASGETDALRAMSRDLPRFTLHAVSEGKEKSLDWGYVASSSGRLGGSVKALMEAFVMAKGDWPEMIVQWRAMKQILEQLRPDVILFDHSFNLLQEWAEGENIPTVILHTPYFMTGKPQGCARMSFWDKSRVSRTIKRTNPFWFEDDAKKALGIVDIGSSGKAPEGAAGVRSAAGNCPHTMIFCEPELLNSATVPARAHAVGPCFAPDQGITADARLVPWLEDAIQQKQRVLYVALGTLANGFLTAEAVGTLLDSFTNLGRQWRVLWSLPAAQQGLLEMSGRQYDARQIRVETYVCQRGVLAHPAVALFLTHGGQSSVNEALFAGKPLLCMPFFCDQYEVAQAVFQHDLGLVFHKDELLAGDHKRLVELALEVANKPRFLEMVRRHAELLRLRAGCDRAAKVVESIVHAGADYQELWQGCKSPSHFCFKGIVSMVSCCRL